MSTRRLEEPDAQRGSVAVATSDTTWYVPWQCADHAVRCAYCEGLAV